MKASKEMKPEDIRKSIDYHKQQLAEINRRIDKEREQHRKHIDCIIALSKELPR